MNFMSELQLVLGYLFEPQSALDKDKNGANTDGPTVIVLLYVVSVPGLQPTYAFHCLTFFCLQQIEMRQEQTETGQLQTILSTLNCVALAINVFPIRVSLLLFKAAQFPPIVVMYEFTTRQALFAVSLIINTLRQLSAS